MTTHPLHTDHAQIVFVQAHELDFDVLEYSPLSPTQAGKTHFPWGEYPIDFALEAQRAEGKPPLEAIYQGCLIRFRPIMMTTFAALMAALPIAVGIGSGARRPLGVAVVGGWVFSQLVTLYLTPVYYFYMDALQRWLQHPAQIIPFWKPRPASA